MTHPLIHVDPAADADSLGSEAKTIRFPITMVEQMTEVGELEGPGRSFSWAVRLACIDLLHRRAENRARLDSPDAPPLVEVTGPWGVGGPWRLKCNGIEVPFVSVTRLGEAKREGEDDDQAQYLLTLTNGEGSEWQTGLLSWGDVWTQAWFWAHAMAISGGWTHHGEDARRAARHGGEWAENGWAAMDAAGSSGAGYGVTVRFQLPSVTDGDQEAYAIEDAIRALVLERGGREPWTEIVAYDALEQRREPGEPEPEPVLTSATADPPGATIGS